MKIILLGCGYLGYNLASLLSAEAETQVIGLPSPYTPLCSHFKEINAFSAEDLDQIDFQDAVVIDTISLLANNARSEDEEKTLRGVEEKYAFLLDELKQRGAKLFIFMSSGGTVYGNASEPISEEAPLHPITLYARSKTRCEQVIRNSGLPYLILRLANPYGGHQTTDKKQGVIPILIEKALNHEVFEMWASPHSSRDYIYIEDFAWAIQLLLKHQIANEVVNVASQTATSLTEILDEVQEKTGQAIEVHHVNSEVPVVDQIVLNIEKLKRLTGFTIQTSLQDGIQKEIERIKNEQGRTHS